MNPYRRITLEKRIADFVENCKCQSELDWSEFAEEVLNEDDRLICTQRRWVYYGTWRITLFVNEYRFGNVLADRLRKISMITHDEDKDFTLADLEEEIYDCIHDFMYAIWDKEIEL